MKRPPSVSTITSDDETPKPNIPTPPQVPPTTLLQPATQKKNGSKKVLRVFRSVFRSFPIFNPTCTMNGTIPRGSAGMDGHIHGARCMYGTLFGHRKARITIGIQETRRSVPILLLELGIQTAKFMQEMGAGPIRIALEAEKKPNKSKLLDEPLWNAFINGKKAGYGTRRVPTDTDLNIMRILQDISMGAGVLPSDMTDPMDGELTYMRAHFDRVDNSKDSETYYMLNSDGNSGPELSVFFVRI